MIGSDRSVIGANGDFSSAEARLIEMEVIPAVGNEATAFGITYIGGAGNQACDIGGKAAAEHKAMVIDQENLPVGIQSPIEAGNAVGIAGAVNAVERNGCAALLIEVNGFIIGGIEIVPVDDNTILNPSIDISNMIITGNGNPRCAARTDDGRRVTNCGCRMSSQQTA